jgi:hypothetical protein
MWSIPKYTGEYSHTEGGVESEEEREEDIGGTCNGE